MYVLIIALFLLTGNAKEKERLAEGVKMQNLENKLSPILQKYVKPGRFNVKKWKLLMGTEGVLGLKRKFRLIAIWMGKPVFSLYGQMVNNIQDWVNSIQINLTIEQIRL